MQEYIWETSEEIDFKIAQRLRDIRKRRKLSQERLSNVSHVSLGTIKRFESTGKISFLSLTKLAVALGCIEELRDLFSKVIYQSIEEVIRSNE
ncbi:MAG: helix-turn-helix transcriptional regulator [Lachnospiraceae bacterium]|nr:helix-turn-helix transcriptional regulator [Lachnospiraceae bacterium]